MIDSLNPNTGAIVGQVPDQSPDEVNAAVARAKVAARRWEALGFEGRTQEIVRFRRALAQRADELAQLIHQENGKPVVDALAEVLLSLNHLNHAAHRAPKALKSHTISPGLMANFKAVIGYHPLGVIGVIGPWNYPMFTPFGSIAYALAAGNAVVFKPSELTPLVGHRICEIAAQSISIPDVLQVVTGGGMTGAALASSDVDKIAFTGSAGTGRKVMAAAAERLTPVLMELGGKDPMIVCEDADVDKAAEKAVFGAMTNAGQACVSVERVYVPSPIFDRFVDKVVDEAENIRFGGGPDAHMGAITMPKQVAIIRDHLEDAIAKGAKILVGGPHKIVGDLVPPTVLIDVTEDMKIMTEETFGPVLPIAKVVNTAEAIERANNTAYGLGSAVFGKDGVMEVAKQIRSGMTSVNDVIAFGSIPGLPFGGVGESGFGRIHGDAGIQEFCRTKAIAKKRFSIPMDMLSFNLPENTADQLRKMIKTLHAGKVLDAADSVLRKLYLR